MILLDCDVVIYNDVMIWLNWCWSCWGSYNFNDVTFDYIFYELMLTRNFKPRKRMSKKQMNFHDHFITVIYILIYYWLYYYDAVVSLFDYTCLCVVIDDSLYIIVYVDRKIFISINWRACLGSGLLTGEVQTYIIV